MAKKEKKKNPVTPIRPCLYPFLKKPDTRWKEDGEYRVSLVFDQDDEFIAKVEKKAEREFKIAKANMKPAQAKTLTFVSPVREEEDDDGKPTGNVKLNFKSKAIFGKGEEAKHVKIKVFDGQGKLIENLPNIGNGSKLSVAFNPVGTVVKGEFYLSLWMNAVQLVELIEYNVDGSSYGFGTEEGGYEEDSEEDPFESADGAPATSEDLDDIPF